MSASIPTASSFTVSNSIQANDATIGNLSVAGLGVSQFLSVKQYGALGDGVTDDYQAIVNTMTAAAQNKIVFFPAGTYAIRQSLPLPDKTSLQGEDKSSCTIKALGNFPVVYEIRASSNPILWSSISNLTIRGSGMTGSNAHGIQLMFANRVTLSNLFFFSCNHGVDLAHQWQTFLTDLHVHGAGTDQNNIGFYFQPLTDPIDNNNAVQAVNCMAQYVSSYGFRLVNANGSKFTNCEADSGLIGFYVGDPASGTRSVQFTHFVNCLGDTNSQYSWAFIRGSATYMGMIQCANCWAGNSNGIGVYISGCDSMSLANWLVISHNQNGIELLNSTNISVTGCTINNYSRASAGAYAGVNIASSNRCAVTGNNTQTTFNSDGIDLNGNSGSNVITGNVSQIQVGNFSSGTNNVIASNVLT